MRKHHRRRSQHRKCEDGPEIPKAAATGNCEANPGSPETPADAGPGTSAVDAAEGSTREDAASGTATPTTDAAVGAKIRAADAADATETAAGCWRISRWWRTTLIEVRYVSLVDDRAIG